MARKSRLDARGDMLQGAMDMLILKSLLLGPAHGHTIAHMIERTREVIGVVGDTRHNALVQWYRSGQDPERRLPLLSTYLGHVHVADTQWYLQASPELMREAMQRLQRRWEDRA